MTPSSGPPTPDEPETSDVDDLIGLGTEIVGTTVAAAIGFVSGGPLGVIAGAAAGPVLTRSLLELAREIRSRLLGHREEVRIGATLTYFLETIKARLADGDLFRTDGFFDAGPTMRSSGEEIMEATLLAAQREPEEAKLRYLGRLLANLMFEEAFDRPQASLLVRTLEDLSYRQLLLLELFLKPGGVIRDVNYHGLAYVDDDGPATARLAFVLSETFDLYTRGLVNNGGQAALGMTSLVPSRIETQGIRPEPGFPERA